MFGLGMQEVLVIALIFKDGMKEISEDGTDKKSDE